jgi:hypothetical protein
MVLRGIGTAIALPMLDGMAKSGAFAAAAPAAVSTAAPTRMAMFFIPNGVNYDHWIPKELGALKDLPQSLQPLAAVKDQLTVLSGLALDNARAKGDGPGDHARSAAAFLTGAHPYKTAGADIRVGVSMDQLAAQKVGRQTKLPSLELGLDKTRLVGNCDSGYACAYVDNISWRSESTPMPKEVDPGALFDRLFGTNNDRESLEARTKRLKYRKSILDFVSNDAKRLSRDLGKNDQRKLEEFTTSIREIERRVEIARAQEADIKPPPIDRPDDVSGDLTEHMKLMLDLLVLAFQMDITRVSTFMIARDGSDRSYRWLGVNEGHHTLSHHGRNPDKIEQIRKIDHYHIQQFAYFVQKLAAIKEGDRSLLDSSMIMLGSGIGDGDRHNHDELPVLLAGNANGQITPGRHLKYPRNTPLCNLYLSKLDRMGVKADRFGDSTGALENLSA